MHQVTSEQGPSCKNATSEVSASADVVNPDSPAVSDDSGVCVDSSPTKGSPELNESSRRASPLSLGTVSAEHSLSTPAEASPAPAAELEETTPSAAAGATQRSDSPVSAGAATQEVLTHEERDSPASPVESPKLTMRGEFLDDC